MSKYTVEEVERALEFERAAHRVTVKRLEDCEREAERLDRTVSDLQASLNAQS